MKKIILISFVAIIIILTSCSQSNPQLQTNSQVNNIEESLLEHDDEASEMETIQNDRRFNLQDTPENAAEDTVANSYRYEITGEHEKLSATYGENEALKISANNMQLDYEKGIYKKEIIIHSLSTLTEEELFSKDFQSANNVQEDIAKYGLVDFKVIAADYSMKWSEKALEHGPQLGDGRYTWFFLCGKTGNEDSWKIYEIYWY